MKLNKRTHKTSINLTPLEFLDIEQEARTMGYQAQRGKKSIQTAAYMRDKILSTKGNLIKIDGIDELVDELNLMRIVGKQISYWNYIVKTANEKIKDNKFLQEKYGDIPYLQDEFLTHIETLTNEVLVGQMKMIKLMEQINKNLLRLEDDYGVIF